MKDLYTLLDAYSRSEEYPFHMPGHKRRIELLDHPYRIDLTEIHGFDNLHHPSGVLKEAQERAARFFGAEETYFLINGSTCGILAAIGACLYPGEKLLMGRSSHKSAYFAASLAGARTEYLYPGLDPGRGIYGSVSPEQVRKALREDGEIKAVFLTSPSYDGVVSDIRGIARIVHEAGGILLVDEAHGAHFGLHPYFPEEALKLGADLVIQSLHKTLPSLTQTALLHVQGERVERERLRKYLRGFQSSSPSYVLMASIDRCVGLLEQRGGGFFEEYTEMLEETREKLKSLSCFHLVTGKEPELSCFDYDRSKLVISLEHTRWSGEDLTDRLRKEYHLELEMSAPGYAVALTSAGDGKDGFDRLARALEELDGKAKKGRKEWVYPGVLGPNPVVYSLREAENRPWEKVPLRECKDRVSGEYVFLYPPGIPLLAPGERISGELAGQLLELKEKGFSLQGMDEVTAEKLRVLKE